MPRPSLCLNIPKTGSSFTSRFFDAADWLELRRRCGLGRLAAPNPRPRHSQAKPSAAHPVAVINPANPPTDPESTTPARCSAATVAHRNTPARRPPGSPGGATVAHARAANPAARTRLTSM